MIKLNKKAVSILLSSCILITTNTLAKSENDGDYVSAITDVNMRIGEDEKRKKLGLFNKYDIAYKILTINDWDLIRYNNKIGFVKNEFVELLDIYDEYKVEHTEERDLLYANTTINMRLSPEITNNKIDVVKQGSILTTIAITNNNWYIVKYNGKIGYISADYVTSLKEQVKNEYNIEIDLKKIVYANKNDYLYDNNGIIIGLINKYETAYLLYENENYSLIRTDKYIGYIENLSLNETEEKFVEIDLEDQEIKLYEDVDILIQANIVSGKNETPTRIGNFSIYNKETDRYLKGEDYNSYVNYWMPFDGGIGLHDATWRNKFGGNIYINKGSHGCVNLPYQTAEYIYENVKVGTKVLVHK